MNKKIIALLSLCIFAMFIFCACGSEDVEQANEADADKSTQTDSDIDTISDLEIITLDGHPTYYGSVEQSHTVWDDVEKGKIQFGDKDNGTNDKPIIAMYASKDSDIISGLLINFEYFDEEAKVTPEEALTIAASYMPFDIMDKYYEYSGSKLIVPDESRKDDPSYYVVSYHLTDEGSEAYYANEHEYSGTINVIIQVLGDYAQNIDFTSGTPRWMSSLEINEYHSEDWTYDFYDHR